MVSSIITLHQIDVLYDLNFAVDKDNIYLI